MESEISPFEAAQRELMSEDAPPWKSNTEVARSKGRLTELEHHMAQLIGVPHTQDQYNSLQSKIDREQEILAGHLTRSSRSFRS